MEKQNLEIDYRYSCAKRKVREIKSFYINFGLYCFCMPIIIATNIFIVPDFHWFWYSVICWGSGVVIHGVNAFQLIPFLSITWESKKLREFIEEENQKNKNI